MFAYFAGFAVFVIVLLWLFQTVFLDAIYKNAKLFDMKRCADSLVECVIKDDIDNGVIRASSKYNNCISVYEIANGAGKSIAGSHIQTNCVIHNISADSLLNEMYSGAKSSKYYIKRIEISTDLSKQSGDDSSGSLQPSSNGQNSGPTTVICSAVTEKNGKDYLILIDSEILPLASTTRVLTYQLTIITVVLLVAAAVISVIISKNIAKPFKDMSREASLLATGRYDVNFDNTSFLEAKQLGDALNYAAGELSKLDSMQKELIANISHDLRTPLTLISGYSEVMRDIPGEMTPDNMQIIIDETARLSSLVSDLLELSKLTSGEETAHPEVFDLTALIEETLKRYDRLVEKDGYKITFEADRNVSVNADKTRILQVLYNLINNAVNYTGDDKTVRVTQKAENGKVLISVTDTGDGIPPEQLPMIWERYYKGGSFHKRGTVGSGLGLSIVKKVLLLHGAHFGVTSKLGSGSTFWFELDEIQSDDE